MAKRVRNIVKIDEDKCNGCGLCVPSCAEGAIQIIDGKARLMGEALCDGLGACLGECPQAAITIEQREAEEFDEAAVEAHLAPSAVAAGAGGCPGAALRVVQPVGAAYASGGCPGAALRSLGSSPGDSNAGEEDDPPPSKLGQWPVQLHLVPPHAPFLAGADLVICADCAPFAVPDFHDRYLDGRAIVVGCPKLDDLQAYRLKLREILQTAKPARLTVLRMEVPCCGGLAAAAMEARAAVAPDLPMEIHVVGIGGGIEKENVATA